MILEIKSQGELGSYDCPYNYRGSRLTGSVGEDTLKACSGATGHLVAKLAFCRNCRDYKKNIPKGK